MAGASGAHAGMPGAPQVADLAEDADASGVRPETGASTPSDGYRGFTWNDADRMSRAKGGAYADAGPAPRSSRSETGLVNESDASTRSARRD